MSGTYPATPYFSSLKISSIQPTLVSVSHSLTRQARSRGSQRWFIEGSYPPLLKADFAPLIGFSIKQRGQYETFTFVLPAPWGTPGGIATGTPLVDGASQSGRSITTKGWTPSKTGILLAGDFIKFSGQGKVYMITANASSDGDGDATLIIEPALMEAPADEEAITVSSVPFTVAFAGDSHEFNIQPGGLHEFKVSFVEAV